VLDTHVTVRGAVCKRYGTRIVEGSNIVTRCEVARRGGRWQARAGNGFDGFACAMFA